MAEFTKFKQHIFFLRKKPQDYLLIAPCFPSCFKQQPVLFTTITPNVPWPGDGYLVAGLAAGLEPLGVVAPAVDLPLLVEVDEVHQQLAAGGALEALGVPAAALPRPARKHRDVPAADLPLALGRGGEGWKGRGRVVRVGGGGR